MNQSEHNLIGKRFGSLTVEGERQGMHAGWLLCACDCGDYRQVQAVRLERGEITACVRCEVMRKMIGGNGSG